MRWLNSGCAKSRKVSLSYQGIRNRAPIKKNATRFQRNTTCTTASISNFFNNIFAHNYDSKYQKTLNIHSVSKQTSSTNQLKHNVIITSMVRLLEVKKSQKIFARYIYKYFVKLTLKRVKKKYSVNWFDTISCLLPMNHITIHLTCSIFTELNIFCTLLFVSHFVEF